MSTDDGRKADCQGRLFTCFLKEFGPCVFGCWLVANLAGCLQFAIAHKTPGMYHPLRYPLPIKVADLLQEMVVFQGGRPTASYRTLGLIVVDGMSLLVGQNRIPGI